MKERYANQDKGVLNAAPDGGKRLVSPRRTTSTTSLIAVGGAAFVSYNIKIQFFFFLPNQFK